MRRAPSIGTAALLAAAFASGAAPAAMALDRSALGKLAAGDASTKSDVIRQAVESGDVTALPVLRALVEGRLLAAGERVAIEEGASLVDPLDHQPLQVDSSELEKVSINNRLRRTLDRAIATLGLFAPDPRERLAAARAVQEGADADVLPVVDRVVAQEKNAEVREVLRSIQGALLLGSPDRDRRLVAVEALRHVPSTRSKRLLLERLGRGFNGPGGEADPAGRDAIQRAIRDIDGSLRLADFVGWIFGGFSLGSVLLLAALGLAITFGLMGVINMAHGEMLMIGAYTTYVVQTFFQKHAPEQIGWYLALSLPAAFFVCMLCGILLERTVIRLLYGRPLETLLATWGVSLVLIQAVRLTFGASNVTVANPVWLSGGYELMPGIVLPYPRIATVLFCAAVTSFVWWLLNRTKLGLHV